MYLKANVSVLNIVKTKHQYLDFSIFIKILVNPIKIEINLCLILIKIVYSLNSVCHCSRQYDFPLKTLERVVDGHIRASINPALLSNF